MTPQEYEEEKKFVLGELADTQFSTDRLSHDILKDWVQPFVDDKEVMMASLVNNSYIAFEASARLKADKEFMHEAVQSCSGILSDASDQLRDDPDVVKSATLSEASAFRFASDRLKSDTKFIAECADENGGVLNYMDKKICSDKKQFLSLLIHTQGMNGVGNIVENWGSDEIKAICKGNSPFTALQSAILQEKLDSNLAPKSETRKQSMKMKI